MTKKNPTIFDAENSLRVDHFLIRATCDRVFGCTSFTNTLLHDMSIQGLAQSTQFLSRKERQRMIQFVLCNKTEMRDYLVTVVLKFASQCKIPGQRMSVGA